MLEKQPLSAGRGYAQYILFLSVWFLVFDTADAGERQLCQLEPKDASWHFRTKIPPIDAKCWYDGPRMKPRSELYWAEAPAWNLDGRFKGAPEGWDHKE
jgi:hypothetical protein